MTAEEIQELIWQAIEGANGGSGYEDYPVSPGLEEVAPQYDDPYAAPDWLDEGFWGNVTGYLGRKKPPYKERNYLKDNELKYIIPNMGMASQFGDLLGEDGYKNIYSGGSLQPHVVSWADAFMKAHKNQGRLPTTEDYADYEYSLENAGSGEGGGWTGKDWIEYYYAKNNLSLPHDWR